MTIFLQILLVKKPPTAAVNFCAAEVVVDVRGKIPRLEEDVKEWSNKGLGLGGMFFCFFVIQGVFFGTILVFSSKLVIFKNLANH